MTDTIRTYLANHKLMTLATSTQDQPWVCTVYYAEDANLSLYFVTGKSNRHAAAVAANPQVAFSIYESTQNVADNKEGFQATGTCRLLTDTQEIAKALKLWHAKNPGVEDHISLPYVSGPDSKSGIFQITPTYMKHFNEALYGENKVGEWRPENA